MYFTNIFFCQLHLGVLILISVGILDLGKRKNTLSKGMLLVQTFEVQKV